MKKIEKLKNEYDNIQIPAELEDIVKSSIAKGNSFQKKKAPIKRWSLGIVAAASIFIGSVNISPTLAQSMKTVPILGTIVEVFTVQELHVTEDTYQANLTTPTISGLDNEGLQQTLNSKYLAENKALFKQFEQEITLMKESNKGHLGVDAGYEILTNTSRLLSIARYEVVTAGSSSTTMKYDTIDKQEDLLITLPSLFKDDRYIDTISAYIISEMERQMAADKDIHYFIDDDFTTNFQSIQPNHNFYITSNHKLVISFDKYEIVPGYMGIVTFEIPSVILHDLLVSDVYIK